MESTRQKIRKYKSRVPLDELINNVLTEIANRKIVEDKPPYFNYYYKETNLRRVVEYAYYHYLITWDNIENFKMNVIESLLYRFIYIKTSEESDNFYNCYSIYPTTTDFYSYECDPVYCINKIVPYYDDLINELTCTRLKDYIIDVNFFYSDMNSDSELYNIIMKYSYDDAIDILFKYMIDNKFAIRIDAIITKDILSPICIFNYPIYWDVYLANKNHNE